MTKSEIKTLCAAAAVLCALLPATASAKKVLYMTTAETPSFAAVLASFETNLAAVAGGASNVISRPGALTTDVLSADDFKPENDIDLVFLVTGDGATSAHNMGVITGQMAARPDLTFVIFADGCCNRGFNATPFADAIKAATGWPLSYSTHTPGPLTLNTNSIYSSSFSSLPSMQAANYYTVSGTPAAYALYLPPIQPIPSLGSTATAAGLLVPQKVYNRGQGSCTFFLGDSNPFYPALGQGARIASSFLHAARDPNGACKKATYEPDLVPTLTATSPFAVNQPQNYKVSIKNEGQSGSTDGTLEITLPAAMTLDVASLPAFCAWAAPKITCTPLNAIASGAQHADITFRATPTAPGLTLEAEIKNVTSELNLKNNKATLTLPLPASVPTLGWPALLGLGALLPLLARRRRKATV